jgi:hypothetical protein
MRGGWWRDKRYAHGQEVQTQNPGKSAGLTSTNLPIEKTVKRIRDQAPSSRPASEATFGLVESSAGLYGYRHLPQTLLKDIQDRWC